MQMKFVPLGLIASILATVSARSLYSENTLQTQNAIEGALKSGLVTRSPGLVNLVGTNVGLDNTGSNILNNLLIAGNANGADAQVLSSGTSSGMTSGASHG